MSAPLYRVRHSQTGMYIADREQRKSERASVRAGFGNVTRYKWVRTTDEAATYACFADAELAIILVDSPRAQVVDLEDRPVWRENAMALGTFHSRGAR